MSKKLSPAMLAMLKSLRDTGNAYGHLRGRSAHGGADKTVKALVQRGLATSYPSMLQLTESGRAALQTEGKQ